MIEIAYRSVYVFLVLAIWVDEYVSAHAAEQLVRLPRFKEFFSTIEIVYIPLLFALMMGSFFLLLASAKARTHAVTLAMVTSVIQQLSRLTSYTALMLLNVFTGFWYFIPVALTFILLVISAVKFRNQTTPENRP
jgi:hypothetical protein